MKKLLIIGLLLTSTAYAQKNDVHIGVDNQGYTTHDGNYDEISRYQMLTIDYSRDIAQNIYTTIGISSGRGQTDIERITKTGTKYSSSPNGYSSFRIGIGFRF